jgi:hypothetical protein
MHAQLIKIIAPARRATPAGLASALRADPPVRPAPISPRLERVAVAPLLDQLLQSVTMLRSAAELVVEGKPTRAAIQSLQRCLPRAARQAEAAMQGLRDLPLAQTALVIDLSQALTVLVLAADMLAHDLFTAPMNLDLYVLLRRNADRAMLSLDTLYDRLAGAN